jgi:hypothetical protein
MAMDILITRIMAMTMVTDAAITIMAVATTIPIKHLHITDHAGQLNRTEWHQPAIRLLQTHDA